MRRWYVVQTQPHAEARAERHLANQGIEAYLPRHRKTRRHARKVETVLAPLFPRYLFVFLDVERERWRRVNGTVGIVQIVCQGDTPAAVPAGIVEEIRSREDESGAVVIEPPSFERGAALRIMQGPLAEQTGLFQQMADQERIVLLLNLLGRDIRVTVPRDAVAAES